MPAGGTQTQMGPCLVEGMGEAGMVAALKARGGRRDQEVVDLGATLGFAKGGVSAAFEQAKEALLAIVASFRGEAENLR